MWIGIGRARENVAMRRLSGIVLAAVLAHAAPALAQAPTVAVAPAAVQKEFGEFLTKFRAALKADDPAAVAAMTRMPFEGDEPVRDAAQFRAKIYARQFTAEKRACLQRGKAVYDRDGDNNDTYAIFCGDLIFTFTKTPKGFLFTDIGAND